MAKTINKDIEVTAGTYSPTVYHGLLTQYHNLSLNQDASEQFIPLTQVKGQSARDALMFVVGVIPPSSEVTGRALDRSASVASIDDSFGPPKVENAELGAAGDSGPAGKNIGAHREAKVIVQEAFQEMMGRPPTEFELQYTMAIGFLETGYGKGWQGAMANSNNWGAVHCSPKEEKANSVFGINIGQFGYGYCIPYTDKNPDGSTYSQTFKAYPDPKAGAKDLIKHIFKHRSTGQGLGPTGSIYDASYIMRRDKYYGGFCPEATKTYGALAAQQSVRTPDKNEGTRACEQEAVTAHALRVQEIINDIAVSTGTSTKLPLGSFEDAKNKHSKEAAVDGAPVAGDAGADGWKGDGSPAAKEAERLRAKTAGTSLNNSNTGQKLQKAQLEYAQMLAAAIESMKLVPPLRMLVNPSSLSVKGEKIVQDGNWSRNGPIVEHWGDNQDSISGSGTVAAFFAMDTQNAGGPGITRYARNASASWKNFQSLYQLYRNNGAIHLPDSMGRGAQTNLALAGSIYIYYDSILYIGSFNSFNITEDATKPFTVEYSFEFSVRASFMLDRVDNEFSYGAPALFPGSAPLR